MKTNKFEISADELGQDLLFFASDMGVWNVSKALKDCEAGLHQVWLLDVGPALEANKSVETDPEKVARFKLMAEVLGKPLVAVSFNGGLCLIDGHHRLRALHQLGAEEFKCWVIEETESPKYAVIVRF